MIEGVADEDDSYTLTSRVTLGNGAVITRKKDRDVPIDDDDDTGSGIFAGGGGELVMEKGSKVTGCATSGGEFVFAPVVVVDGAKFTMNGGVISKNTTNSNRAYGGGVSVYGGEFIMNGGEISGNTADQGATLDPQNCLTTKSKKLKIFFIIQNYSAPPVFE
jgi:hypothetical protein